jgi:hypothetical protein
MVHNEKLIDKQNSPLHKGKERIMNLLIDKILACSTATIEAVFKTLILVILHFQKLIWSETAIHCTCCKANTFYY